jgi:anion-transporting  ArsA/GET3 family ATPase
MRTPFFRETRLLIVAGKGGVGKTTVAAVTAAAAAADGLRTLLVSVDTPAAAAAQFGVDPFTDSCVSLMERLDGRLVTPDQSLIEWLTAKRLGKLADRLVKSGALDMIATAVPGIRDILVLGRIKALVNENAYDLIVLDGPASGHAVTMLHSAAGLRDSVGVGAIRQQADDVGEMLNDRAVTQVVLVTLPETTPVSESIETAFALEETVGVRLGPVIVNRVLSPLTAQITAVERQGLPAGTTELLEYRAALESAQQAVLNRLRAELPLTQIVLPHEWTDNAVERRIILQAELLRGLST